MSALRTSTAVDAVLAALDPNSGKVRCGDYFRIVFVGGLLVDLAREGRISVSGTGEDVRARVLDSTRLDVPHGSALWDLRLGALTLGLRTRVAKDMKTSGAYSLMLDYLVATDRLALRQRRILGLFTLRRYYPLPLAGRDDLVVRLRAVLLGDATPDDRIGPLAALLARKTVPHARWVPKDRVKEARARAQEIAESDLLSSSERAIVSAVHFAMDKAYARDAKGF